ncbi:Zinc finger, RING-type [Sesbania bispinosa]|nr:Zinc finger, RING-type [Sesbania bispinosa]
MTMAQLPCDDKGVCMVCKSLPTKEGKLVCFTCETPWHVACLSSLPPTLASTIKWSVETDASLSREEKNKKQQDLMSGKAGKAVEEKDKNENGKSTPCGHTFCLKCFKKLIQQGKRTCSICRQGIPAKMANQPRINSALAHAICIAKKDDSNGRVNRPSRVPPYTNNQDKPDQPYMTDRAQRKGRANAANRLECRQWGAHFLPIGGIAGQSNRGAQSVVLSGGYVDDEDHGECGGKDLTGKKRTNKNHSFDQKFEKYNRALQISCQEGYPVRVVSDDRGDRPKPLPFINELQKATTIFERTKSPAWDFDDEDSCWKWKKPPPPSRKKVQIEESTKIEKSSKGKRKFQKMSIKEQLRKGFSCQICKHVMDSPVTTPCGHNFCKSCLEGAFAGQTFMRERNICGRTLRSQKNVMKCPTCTIDISDYLQNFQVDIGLKGVIESLKAKIEENGETLEASEDIDRLQENGVEETNKATDSVVKHNAKRKKIDSTKQFPEMSDDGKMNRGKEIKAEKVEDEENVSPLSPLNMSK